MRKLFETAWRIRRREYPAAYASLFYHGRESRWVGKVPGADSEEQTNLGWLVEVFVHHSTDRHLKISGDQVSKISTNQFRCHDPVIISKISPDWDIM